MLAAVFLVGLLATGPAGAVGGPEEVGSSEGWHRLVGILQYMEQDYPVAVAEGSAFELEEQAAFAEEAVRAAGELGPAGAAFAGRLEELRQRVLRKDAPAEVSRDCAALVEDLVRAGGLARSPRRPPDLREGEALFQVNCAACHGRDGKGETEVAATLEPRPYSFLDPERMDGLTPYKAFNSITFGVTGTGMPAYDVLPEKERWTLAFYLFTLRQPACEGAPPAASLESLASGTDKELAAAHGAGNVACLRRRMPDADEERSLVLAREGVEEALRRAERGDVTGARKAVLDAYLQGVEPVEPLLRAREPALVQELEAGFGQVRLALEQDGQRVEKEGRALLSLIDRARRSRPAAEGFVSVLWLAMLILLREGFEATVVIAALLAVLKKLDQPQHARVVHAGWTSAALVGAGAFVFGRRLLAGANRELLEGGFALLAVGMLVYAALWLNARANLRKFMGQLRNQMEGALGRGSALGLFGIAFTAMLRESVETAIFLEGLSIDSPAGVAWGVGAGLVVLLALVLFIRRVGYRLPMKALFNASTVLLLATAVMLLGSGLHALQEVGMLPLRPLGTFRVEALGVYADAVTLLPQLLLAGALAYVFLRRRDGAPPQARLFPGDQAEAKSSP